MEKFYKKIVALVLLVTGLSYNSLYAQIAAWQFSNLSTTLPAESSVNVSTKDDYLTVGALTLGSGLKPTLIGGTAFGSQPNVSTTADLAGIALAVANNDYYSFTVTPKSNYKVSLDEITFKMRLSGARYILVRYSIDGINFNDVSPAFPFAATGGSGAALPSPIDLSNIIDLQNVLSGTIITFRIYHSGSNNSTGTTALGRSASALEYGLSVTGNVKPITAPASILAWQLFNPLSVGSETAIDANVKNAGLETSSLVRGAGLRNKNNSNVDVTYPGTFVAGATVATAVAATTDIADAITNNLYFGFQVKPVADNKASLSTLRAKVRASGGGAKTWLWRYSTDGINFTDLGTVYYNAGTILAGVNMPDVDLSGITQLQNLTPSTTVYFRLYVQGSNATTGSTGLGISSDENTYALSLNGTIESTLPVKLTTFTGRNSGRNVRLNWATASEKENAYFDVLRIQKDKSPLNLGRVLGNGNSDVTNNYSFTDYNPQSGTNYYQLRQVDKNGDFELSQIIPVKVSLSSSQLVAYYKGEVLNLNFDAESAGIVNIKVADISGRTVYNTNTRIQAGKNELQIPASLNKGVYVVSLNGNDISISKKIIK